MAGKLPAFLYYPKDWQADSVFGCSLAARGLWHEMINVMHGCEPYGHLAENGAPMADERIARKCGATVQEYVTLLAELEAAGVPRRTRAGIIYSKRMVEDRLKRDEWRKRQKKHRVKGSPSHAPVTRDVTRLSRPSSFAFASPKLKPLARSDQAKIQGAEPSPTVEKDARAQKSPALTEEADASHFARFTDAYPPHRKPTSPLLEDAFKIWQRLSVREQLWAIKSLTGWNEFWAQDQPRFVPEMIKFLRQKLWERQPPPRKEKDGKRKYPGSDSTQDHIDRAQRTAKALGLDNP
jgi:hypothetical protein